MAYVIKSWRASNQMDEAGSYVNITGRKEGLISAILAHFGIDPTVKIMVNQNRIEFSEFSLSGTVRRLIPFASVCSTYYGYHKPWKKALGIAALLCYFITAVGNSGGDRYSGFSLGWLFFGLLLGSIVGVIYYFLNRTLTLGFVENSGVVSAIRFKRSVVENQDINETQAGYVCEVVQFLVENHPSR